MRSPWLGPLLYILRRAAMIFLVLLGVCTVTFIVTRLLGNPVYLLVGQQANKEILDNMIHQMGLDRPLYEQYLRYLWAVARGDLGMSRYTFRPVLEDIRLRLPATFELVTAAMWLIVFGGVPLGVLAAARPRGIIARFAQFLSQLGVSMPSFWVGLLLIYFFFFRLHWFPAPLGRLADQIAAPPRVTGLLLVDSLLARDHVAFRSALGHLVLPAVTLALGSVPATLQITRTTLLQVLASDYIRTARAYGMPARAIYFRYALKNVVVPLITVLAMTFGYLMSGTVLVETVFAWPGLGLYAVDAMNHFDYEPIVGVVLLSALFYALAYLVADLVSFAVDPRIRAQ